ncbi:MAG: hypothetical protein ABI175_07015, partial [Polyangiales bacterium]
ASIAVLGFAVSLVSAATVVGCGQSGSQESPAPAPATVRAPLATSDLVGRWQFVFTDEVRDAFQAKVAKKITDPIELEKAMKEADEEARASELEFTSDGVFVSRVLGQELVRRPYQPRVASDTTVVLEDGPKKKEIVFDDHDTISIFEPGKGHLVYTRIADSPR